MTRYEPNTDHDWENLPKEGKDIVRNYLKQYLKSCVREETFLITMRANFKDTPSGKYYENKITHNNVTALAIRAALVKLGD